ncbi:hypothetical protein Fsol_00453 [Candidatus Fokinia solitaria]|uniref:Outer membrane lipoprotein n=1 Tax=Candidatus Fokinia solitaria TaxID=1802984 RepID=A0A2U8BSH1_9RICK|nr:hypothetical protein [Candidatus Fokinia solitaria]AWD33248.1 hypothetical protein Fsol_00453 [Candidatus Fokinia solitaria]
MFLSFFARILPVLSIILIGCSNEGAVDMYQNSYEGGVAIPGKVISVRKVMIGNKKQNSTNNTIAGSAVGGLAGVGLGHSPESALLGAVMGGAIGYAASEAASGNYDGSEYVVKIDTSALNQEAVTMGGSAFLSTVNAIKSTGLVVVAQKDRPIAVGRKVYVLIAGSGSMRVIPAE